METTRLKTSINPFRPGVGLYPACLAGRATHLEQYSKRLYAAMTGTPKNIWVHGNARMGKTSLLIQMEMIAEEKNILALSTIGGRTSFKEFIFSLVSKLLFEVQGSCPDLDIQTAPFMLRLEQVDQKSFTEIEIIFSEILITVWERVKDKFPAILYLIDDLELLEEKERAIYLLQNVTKNIYRKNVLVLFALSTSTQFYEEMQKKYSDLSFYFDSFELGKLLFSSSVNAIQVPLWSLEIPFDEAVIQEIADRADGFPFYLQAISYYVFEEVQKELDMLTLRRGYTKALQALERDLFDKMLDALTPTEGKIYCFIFENEGSSFTQILKALGMPKGSVASSLKRLKEKQMVKQQDKKHIVSDRLFGAYLVKKGVQL